MPVKKFEKIDLPIKKFTDKADTKYKVYFSQNGKMEFVIVSADYASEAIQKSNVEKVIKVVHVNPTLNALINEDMLETTFNPHNKNDENSRS